eukprot:CAMPEP_0177791712 /NCGR_PEP_ID=MMETSP0491_2-20121128/24096_1 /TAXON_ID=63592 /ORGANISM="Tetraselmis chuii, Strain PLY429" /LENGTH=698 /DNA_ID=CAMNT_0019313995 /DNA_START=331 /DNA_END=2423 /DNA_ORIENTATION=+
MSSTLPNRANTGGSGSGREQRKGHKRKLADAAGDGPGAAPSAAPVAEVRKLLGVLNSSQQLLRGSDQDVLTLRRAAHSLTEIAKIEENVDVIVKEGGIHTVVPLLSVNSKPTEPSPSGVDEIEKEACFTLGLLAIKTEHQHHIADAGALAGLIRLLLRSPPSVLSTTTTTTTSCGGGVVRRAADAITNLAHENAIIKSRVRTEGGIPPLVELLDSMDPKIQRAAAGALRTLAFKNEENKLQIVDSNTLPTLIQMLRSEDSGIHYEAVGVIGNLVHSSPSIKRLVLDEGALQPVIGLLSSRCTESQREAALLLGQFATADPDFKAKIVQRGGSAVMLGAKDLQLREMAAFALGRLAQNADNQAGIIHAGGLKPLLDLVDSRNGNLQHNAAFALYGLADNEDNIADIIREGGVQRLVNGNLIVQPSKDCVQKTLKRLEEKVSGKVLRQVLYMMRSNDKVVRQRTASALARLASGKEELYEIFVKKGGLNVLLNMVMQAEDDVTQMEGAAALFDLATKANAIAPIDVCEPPPPTPKVYLGEEHVNNKKLSDVSFLVEGREFFAHRAALCASSDAFRAMFSSGYREKEACTKIEIPNITWSVFEAMMKCIYTGNVDVTPDIAEDLLRVADQYLLDGLKRLCENAISQGLAVDNLSDIYALSESFHAPQLAKHAVMYALEHYIEVVADVHMDGYCKLMEIMLV